AGAGGSRGRPGPARAGGSGALGGLLVRRGVADISPLDVEDDVFGNVRGVVGDALVVARDQQQVERARGGARILHHVGQQLAEELLVQRVDLVIASADFVGGAGVTAHEAV